MAYGERHTKQIGEGVSHNCCGFHLEENSSIKWQAKSNYKFTQNAIFLMG